MNTERNIYRNDVNFSILAQQFPSFAKFLKPNGQLDFNDPEAVQELTRCLLKRDFNLDLELPSDRLCPPVPNRLNYVLWIQDLLDTTSDEYGDLYDPERNIVGMDIGTGASCIYPLLACSQRPNWRFIATDIDEKNLQYAIKNITANSLGPRIKVKASTIDSPLIPLDEMRIENIDFTMCNPPFYRSAEDMFSSAKQKEKPSFSACTGAPVEMATAGGEVAFVERMIKESIVLQDRVEWYTTMLGKLSSVPAVVDKLKESGVKNWAVTELIQGNKTRRWAVGWSWGDMRPRMDVARGISGLAKQLLPFPSEFTFQVPLVLPSQARERVDQTLKDLSLQWQWRSTIGTGVGFAKENVWSRASRRKGPRSSNVPPNGERETDTDEGEGEDEDQALGFKIQVAPKEGTASVDVRVRWLKGNDTVLFESFCGMLKRKTLNP